MDIIIVTGLSGSGKTQAIKSFEDLNYFCMDNMLPDLIPNFIDFSKQMKTHIQKVALGIDIRGGDSFENLLNVIEKTKDENINYEILFIECNDDVLIKRYKENRRNHPLAQDGRIIDGIKLERERLKEIKQKANYIIDTSNTNMKKLKEKIIAMFSTDTNKGMVINVMSFGFKYGIPSDADFVFDVRFLENPYYIEELKVKTGKDKEVYDFVMSFDETKEFVISLENMFKSILPSFIKEGRTQLVIAIGCTGGQHRSVTVARVLSDRLKEAGFNAITQHREI